MPISAGQYQPDKAYEGQIVSAQCYSFLKGTFEELVNKDTEVIPYGRFVINGDLTQPGYIKLPTAADITGGANLLGVNVFTDTEEKDADGVAGTPVDRPTRYLYKGVVAMIPETAMTRNGAIYVRQTDNVAPGALEFRGRIRADDDGGNAVLLPATSGKILEDAAAGEIVFLELDLSPLLN